MSKSDEKLATPERQNPGPATHAEQAAKATPHVGPDERRRLAEEASREEDA